MLGGFITGVVVFIIIALCIKYKFNPIIFILEVVGEFFGNLFDD